MDLPAVQADRVRSIRLLPERKRQFAKPSLHPVRLDVLSGLISWRAAMTKKIVAGCTLVALIFMVILAYAQGQHECWKGHHVKTLVEHGHLIKAFKPCGSVSPQM